MRWLILLFVVVPLAELYLLLLVGSLIGFWPTVGLTLVTGIVGGALAKHEGLRVWRAWRRSLQQLTPPEAGVIDGVLVLLGGALLITPGVMTDVVGLLLLVPPSRRAVASRIRAELDRRLATGNLQVMGGSVETAVWPRDDAPGGDESAAAGVVETTGETVDSD